ncbi:MAG TPA: winged helix-turn-helix domain-containing protein [Bryobacteraceae bacterium]|nr:winged helix-turn-helix domain-containing protein [Bryobacteraceae bacterium]
MARVFEFGPFRLDERERTLECEGSSVNVTPKAFDVLLALLANANRLVEKSTLLRTVWGDVHVDDAVLTRAISDLRKALGQNGEQTRIETVPKFGYRFVADVRVIESGQAAVAARPKPRRLWPVAIVVAAGLLALVIARGTSGSRETIHSLVVLPFQAVGGTGDQAALRVGLADALITRLSSLEGLVVRPLSTVRRFEQTPTDPLRAAQELQADAVLEGTLQFGDGSVRASVRLVRAGDGKALWTETVDSKANRFFDMEDSLAEQLAAKLSLLLPEDERRDLPVHRELNEEAHRLYVQGRYEWGKRTQEGFEKAAGYFRQAIDRDPGYARAYAGLADCYLLLGLYSYAPPLDMLPKAKVTALRALELEPRLADAHATLGLITQNLDWDWVETERHYRESIRLAPNYSTAHEWYAEFLSIQGRFDESRQEFARARQIDPISPIIQVDEAQLFFFQRDYGRNLALLEKVSREDPSFALARERMAFTHLIQGREEDAWREAMSLPDCASETSDCRHMWTAWLPRRDPLAARKALEQLEAGATAGRVPAYTVMFGNARQGHIDRALDWLERMRDTHAVWLITAKVNPMFDALRGEPRAKATLAQLHLDQAPNALLATH